MHGGYKVFAKGRSKSLLAQNYNIAIRPGTQRFWEGGENRLVHAKPRTARLPWVETVGPLPIIALQRYFDFTKSA